MLWKTSTPNYSPAKKFSAQPSRATATLGSLSILTRCRSSQESFSISAHWKNKRNHVLKEALEHGLACRILWTFSPQHVLAEPKKLVLSCTTKTKEMNTRGRHFNLKVLCSPAAFAFAARGELTDWPISLLLFKENQFR